MNKICRIGTIKTWRARPISVFINIEIKEGKLSITGVEGPLPSGNCMGGCGQISMEFDHADKSRNDSRFSNLIKANEINYAPGWNAATWLKLLDIWDNWHLNDMSPACEHQRALGWMDDLVDPNKPKTQDNMKGWNHPPAGHLGEPCPVCGYKYGTAWLKRELPADVITFLQSLPDTDKTPAWV